ncbi:MAG: molecular chaperone DnaJ [Candidatus Eremiobacteraeota bacterium]|nr:molecular chaperone DnaJ [Candidatus Eremiobacteraeota bacterium]MBC5827332.1 molecular chaperone DnaJ [Candidatus Eremiobacteraeota bacterium]
MQKDYYEVLGVSRSASDDDIKRAYRNLARKLHPDVVREGDKVGAEARFKQINEAYGVLSDSSKRAHYDRFGHDAGPAATGGFGTGEGVGDIFDMFFGGFGASGRRQGPANGSDLRYDLQIDLHEVLAGTEREISFSHLGVCGVCGGVGSADGQRPTTCPDCRGSGQLRTARQTALGQFVTTVACIRCGGTGGVVANPCPACRGEGRREQQRKLTVKIPPGVAEGTRLRYSAYGEAGERGGAPGDLYVYVGVRAHDVFERDGANLHCETGVSFTQAALGAKMEIEGLDGPVTLDLPAGSQTGSRLRVAGRGLPSARGRGRGDLLVDIQVRVPTKLSRKQRELLEAFAQAGGEEAESRGWFRRKA